MYKTLIITILWAIALPHVFAQKIPLAPEIGIVEHLNDTIPADILLVSEENNTVNLLELIDKPTVISLVYYRCPGICSPLMNGLADVIDQSDLQIGKDYQVFTISFDPREDYMLAARKKKNYINMMNDSSASDGWFFFTADSQNIKKLTKSLGFNYKMQGNDFLHAGALMVLSPNGKITRYLNGISFLPFELKMALIEASEGKVGPTINKVLKICFTYDPTGEKYVLNITRVAGGIIMLIAILFFITLLVKPLRNRKSNT